MEWTRKALEERGFKGFKPLHALARDAPPMGPGVYVVLRESVDPPEFDATSPAGHFKGKDPTIDVEQLRSRWVPGAEVIYIGKASKGQTGRGLAKRLGEYRRHGAGELIGHWGGRAIWQLSDRDRLLVAWMQTGDDDPEQVESALLDEFAADFDGRLPFANRKKGSHQAADTSPLLLTTLSERACDDLTIGIDLAAEPERTWLAVLAWSPDGAELIALSARIDDSAIREAAPFARMMGIDCPFGWPDAFVHTVSAHRAGTIPAPVSFDRAARRLLALRDTDRDVHTRTGITPLSVSADRIAHVAMRCAALQASLAHDGIDCSRDGSGHIAEVYPAAALKIWGLPYRGYKGTNGRAVREGIVDELIAQAPWLTLGHFEEACRRSDDALDAVLSALVARAVVDGHTRRPEPGGNAAGEGWIHIPEGPLPFWRADASTNGDDRV